MADGIERLRDPSSRLVRLSRQFAIVGFIGLGIAVVGVVIALASAPDDRFVPAFITIGTGLWLAAMGCWTWRKTRRAANIAGGSRFGEGSADGRR